MGAERLFLGQLFVPGSAVNMTCKLDAKFQDATTETGTYTDMPGGAFETWTQVSTTAAQALVVSTTGAVSGTEGPWSQIPVRTRANRPWVRVFLTPDGTSVQYTAAVVAVPLDTPAY